MFQAWTMKPNVKVIVPCISDSLIGMMLSKFLECIQSLYFHEWNVRRDQVAEAEKGTNDWIWTNDQYEHWENAPTAVLWVEGKPGSGKSVLAKTLQRKLKPSLPRTGTDMSTASGPRSDRMAIVRSKVPNVPLVADWFYSTRHGEVGMAHLSLLRSVLYQLLEQHKSFFEFIAPSYRRKPLTASGEQREWRATEFNRALEKISESGTSVICIIDAMDEAKEAPVVSTGRPEVSRTGTILKTLWSLMSGTKSSKIKFIVLSRPDPLIEMDFYHIRKTFPDTYKIVLEHENHCDIDLVIGKGLRTLNEAIYAYDSDLEDDGVRSGGARKYKGLDSARAALSRSEDVALENIKLYLQKYAEGVILWVTLILGELEDLAYDGLLNLTELEERAKGLPRELDSLYEHIVTYLQERSSELDLMKTRSTLILVAGSALLGRPLRVREMWEALAIPSNIDEALNMVADPIISNRTRINSWAGFRRQLRKRCGPLIEIVNASELVPGVGPDDVVDEDIGPEDIVQFMHRTVKDFLLSQERSGPLHFSEDMAAEQVTLMAKNYLRIGFPQQEPKYGPRLSKWKAKQWRKNISEYVNHLEDKILLQFSISILTEKLSDGLLELGYLAEANNYVLGSSEQRFDFPKGIRDFYPEFNAKSRNASLGAKLSDLSLIALGEFFAYACTNGLVVATQNLLEICKKSLKDDPQDTRLAMGNGALLAAIRHNLCSEVRTLTISNRHQPRLLATVGGWPIGRDTERSKLDPFIRLAVRSGSVDVASYLFEHTDLYYARNSAVREFAVTEADVSWKESQPGVGDEDSSAASLRSFDLMQLGLVDKAVNSSDTRLTSLAPEKEQAPLRFRPTRRYDGDRDEIEGWHLPVTNRDTGKERKREQREFWKLRETCIDAARQVHIATQTDESSQGYHMDDIKESLKLVINACVRNCTTRAK
jgi:hypothetical protein